jgi:hypothetical protein
MIRQFSGRQSSPGRIARSLFTAVAVGAIYAVSMSTSMVHAETATKYSPDQIKGIRAWAHSLATLSVPKIISGHIDDAGRLIRVLPLCSRTVGRLD